MSLRYTSGRSFGTCLPLHLDPSAGSSPPRGAASAPADRAAPAPPPPASPRSLPAPHRRFAHADRGRHAAVAVAWLGPSQPVARAPDGQDVPRLLRLGLEFLAPMADMDVDRRRISVRAVSPPPPPHLLA